MLPATTRSRRRSLLIRKVMAALQPQLAEFPLEHGHPTLPVTWRRPATSPGHLPSRLHLWHDEDVQALLQPATMRLGSVVNPDTLHAFLRRSQG